MSKSHILKKGPQTVEKVRKKCSFMCIDVIVGLVKANCGFQVKVSCWTPTVTRISPV
jgi:hypothetical protein